jgi:hypothetical protein
MIKITNEVDGVKYELVPRIGGVREPCRGCAHYNGWTGGEYKLAGLHHTGSSSMTKWFAKNCAVFGRR